MRIYMVKDKASIVMTGAPDDILPLVYKWEKQGFVRLSWWYFFVQLPYAAIKALLP